jgi:hypothetical protein
MLQRLGPIVVFALFATTCTTHLATAEVYLDFYGSYGLPSNKPDPVIRQGEAFADTVEVELEATLRDIELDPFLSGGLRLGYWLPFARWLGLGVDLSIMRLEVPDQIVTAESNRDATIRIGGETFTVDAGFNADLPLPGIDIITAIVAIDVLSLRLPLFKTVDRPQGLLQPYIMAGPALMLVLRNADVRAEISTTLGLKTAAGIAWHFHRHVALFAEYRFTHFEPTIDTGNVNVNGVEAEAELDFTLDTHYINFGLSFRFL